VRQPEDREAVAAVLAGDVDAYAVLVRRYQDAYRRFATRMLGSADDADDALQLAFVRAYRALGQCADPGRFAAWLYQIVLNECRTFDSRRKRRERRVVPDEDALAEAPDRGEPADSEIALDAVQRAVDGLEAGQREAFLLKHVEGMSYEEMAALTGVSQSALKMRVKRAVDRLRGMLQEEPLHDK
jgi:RNA polymerase sigma-70 factor, ECF subfamily